MGSTSVTSGGRGLRRSSAALRRLYGGHFLDDSNWEEHMTNETPSASNLTNQRAP